MITKFKLFERKGNYQLFHKTSNLNEIVDSGYIEGYSGGVYDMGIRQNVIANWKRNTIKTISATRNFDYLHGDALELDVEKVSDRYKIIPYSENPDFYLDFDGKGWNDSGLGKMEPYKNKNLSKFQQQVHSKSKNAGKLYWRVKTDKGAFDFGIAEELILADKLDIGKYVKRIFIKYPNESLERKIKEKYPQIEVVIIADDGWRNSNYFKNIHKKKFQKKHQYQEV